MDEVGVNVKQQKPKDITEDNDEEIHKNSQYGPYG
jgi:hypothetical protein